ncbi:MAG: hypothetical protein ABJB11_19245 [Ferruginibacter sp.]
MKNNIHTNPLLLKMIILITCFMLVMLYNESYATTISPSITDKGIVQFQPNAEKHELNITLISNTKSNEKYQLFIFTTDGILVEETSISTQDMTTIKELKRGYYLYELFDNDTKLKSGLFTME